MQSDTSIKYIVAQLKKNHENSVLGIYLFLIFYGYEL
jgi:hypothetical protein